MKAVFNTQGRRVDFGRSCWRFERYGGFLEQKLIGSFPKRKFKRRMRVSKCTFKHLCTLLGPIFFLKNTHFRKSITVKCKIAVTLSRLAIGTSLRMIGDIYAIGLDTISTILRECCETIKIQLQPLVFCKTNTCEDEKNRVCIWGIAWHSFHIKGNRWQSYTHSSTLPYSSSILQ